MHSAPEAEHTQLKDPNSPGSRPMCMSACVRTCIQSVCMGERNEQRQGSSHSLPVYSKLTPVFLPPHASTGEEIRARWISKYMSSVTIRYKDDRNVLSIRSKDCRNVNYHLNTSVLSETQAEAGTKQSEDNLSVCFLNDHPGMSTESRASIWDRSQISELYVRSRSCFSVLT